MPTTVQKLVGGDELYIPGNVTSDADGSRAFSLIAGEARTIRFPFSIGREASVSGVQLERLAFIYQLTSGTLTSLTDTLTRIVHSAAAVETRTDVPTTQSGVVLSEHATNFNKAVSTVTTPSYDNQATGVDVSYQLDIVLTATTACSLVVHGVEVVHSSNAGAGLSGSGVAAGRYQLEEVFAQLPRLNASIADSPNLNFELLGTNAVDGSAAYSTTYAGVQLTTAGADNDQVILLPHLDAEQTAWAGIRWGTENQTKWEVSLRTGADVTTVLYWAGLKLTNTPTIATDNDQVFFRFDTDVPDTNWQVISSIGGVDTTTDSAVAVAASTTYALRIEIDSSRIAKCYINDVLVHTTAALTDDVDLIPYVGVQALAAAARNVTVSSEKISRVLFE